MKCKRCTKCGAVKGHEEFGRRYDYPDKLLSWCRLCDTERKRTSAAVRLSAPTVRAAVTHRQKLWRYGLSEVEYAGMVERHAGHCAICNAAAEVLRIDHDHASGLVRGLLCHNCNVGLGHFKDSADILGKAAAYLCKKKSPTS